MKLAYVFVEHPILHLDHTFAYSCAGMRVQRGVRVAVPFGSTRIIGFVERVEDVSEQELAAFSFTVREILEVIDEEPLLNEELFALGGWMADTLIAPRIACFQCMLPAKLKPRSKRSRIKKEAWVRIAGACETALSAKQEQAYAALKKQGECLRSEFYKQFKSPGKKLIELGLVQVFEKEVAACLKEEIQKDVPPVLTPQQQSVIREVQADHASIFLLHGATGSGKTEVFLQLASDVIKKGRQVLILVPEISLTPQMVRRVKARFQNQVAIYHSALNAQEKYEQYQLVKQRRVSIVVGTRSAVFMPFERLGLIIMDEEHDSSYKQDVSPRYHCRDIALKRGSYHQASVVLASATPSLESYARAHKGVYRLLEMPERINGSFPKVRIVEMRKAVEHKESYLLSNALRDAIHQRLQKKEQVILLLNRRGYTPILRCISCGYVQMCPHCEVAMSFHKEEGVLKCHTCGFHMPVPSSCPSCHHASWRYLGSGTQKLEELVQLTFPAARILRMDADTTSRKQAHAAMLEAFERGEADILLGTQMIAKGLDFERVTLTGIVNGDALLNRSDYRSAEMTYDLLEQAGGRSGRGEKKGEVILQVYDASHYAITCAARHDYRTFFVKEMQYRHMAQYPPYCYLAAIIYSHKKEELVDRAAAQAMQLLRKKEHCRILGPASLHKLKDEYRVRILLKGKRQELLSLYVRDVYEQHVQQKQRARMDIDLAPILLE